MKVLIPMAGHSRHFKQAGYDDPKPFIMIDGMPMMERACQMFSQSDEFIFVCNREHLRNEKYLKIVESLTPSYKIVEIVPHELGPLYSALQAEKYVDDKDEPIIISYCDFTAQWNYRQFLLKVAQYEGAIAVFKGFHPASFGNTYYAYIKANGNFELEVLREKQSFTDKRWGEFASIGVYYVESWKTFAYYAEKVLQDKPAELSEYYVSLIYNPMVQNGERVCLFEVEKFICWGTPQDLEEYLFWSDYFANDVPRLLS